jgi:hypothetical protein
MLRSRTNHKFKVRAGVFSLKSLHAGMRVDLLWR